MADPNPKQDGGYRSRKMVMAYFAMMLVLAGYLISGYYPALQVVYGEFCAAILGCATIYVGSNAAVKWVSQNAKTDVVKVKKVDKPEEKAPVEQLPPQE